MLCFGINQIFLKNYLTRIKKSDKNKIKNPIIGVIFMETCIVCKQNPIVIKKRSLCAKCYQAFRKKRGRLLTKESLYCEKAEEVRANRGEVDFIKNFFKHQYWYYQPALFRINNFSYTPDFYDGARNVFIEVVSSRQAYHQNKDKYIKFVNTYPKLGLEIRLPTGELLEETEYGKKWEYQLNNGSKLAREKNEKGL